MNYYNYHIGDYRTATAHLNLEEDATYKRLLDYQYDKEKPILDDPSVIARRIRSTEPLVRAMLTEFFTLTQEGWIHRRVMEDVQKHQEFIDKQAYNGRKGGRKPNANPTLSQRQPSQLPIPNTQLPIKDSEYFAELPEQLRSDDFCQAWLKYVEYRRERGLKALYPTSVIGKWNQMAEWGAENSIKSIEQAIANGWQGTFAPDKTKEEKKPKSPDNSKYKDIF